LGVRDLQALLDSAAGQPSERLVSMLVLRSMMRAVYSPDPRGHFALAADAYAHFTSPIRRYPDLVVHRALRRLLAEGRAVDGEAREAMETALESLGDHCSKREQRAEAAERMAVQWRTMRFLMDKVGEVVDGRVSGVTDFGLFVQLDEYAVDGLVHIAELVDDFYEHDAVAHCLVGSRTGRRWRLGDEIRVRLARVDEESMQLQLVPADMRPDAHATGPKGRPKGGSRRPREAAPAAPPKNRGARPKGTARPSRRGRGGRGKK
jgi:ribonuclease R